MLNYRSSLGTSTHRRFTKTALKCVSFFVFAFALMANSYAQDGGSIRGNVKNLTTGKALVNATVTIEETGQKTVTDEYGTYRFSNVAPGSKTVRAEFTGLQPKDVVVQVTSGGTATGNLSLYSNRVGLEDEDVFELEAFTVDGSDYDSNAIAQQERRASSSLKLVQHAEALGEIAEGNIGEFLKNLPGVAIDYVAADARSIKLRGMDSDFTQVTVDGAQMASAGSSNAIRRFELEQVSIANVEQLEVSKLPRADMSANSIGGSVNLVSKNAFAQGGRQIKYKVHTNWNSDAGFDLSATPGHMADLKTHKTNLGWEFGYSDVLIEDKLGVSFTTSNTTQYNIQQRLQRNGTFRVLSDGSIRNDRIALQDGPKWNHRESYAANLDFKATDNTVLTLRAQGNVYNSEFGNKNYNWRIATTDVANSSGGHIEGTPNNGSTNIGSSNRNKYGTTWHADFGVKHNFENWNLDYGVWNSEATNHYRSYNNGYVERLNTGNFITNAGVTKLAFDSPSVTDIFVKVTAYDADGNVVPNGGINLEDGEITYVRDRPKDGVDTIKGARFNAKYNFQIGDNNASFKFGYMNTKQNREVNEREIRYNVIDGSPTDDFRIDALRDETYVGISPGFGYPAVEWPSNNQAFDYFKANQSDFLWDTARSVSGQNGRWFDIQEVVTAYYAMGQLNFANNKGVFTAGVRKEETDVSGLSPIVGETFLDETGWITGGFQRSTSKYSTTHPSFHVRYNFTPNLVGRFAYADTLGRPNFSNMFGPVTITLPEDDDDGGNRTVKLKNPGLLPRRSDNIDATLEYYFGDTGLLSASVFQNDITDYEGTADVQMTTARLVELGIDIPEPAGGFTTEDKINQQVNAGDATVDGLEISYNQGLNFDALPAWLRGSSFYANGTFLSIDGNFAGTAFSAFNDNLPGFAKQTIAYGFIYDHGPFNVKLRRSIRGKEIESSTTVIDGVRSNRFIGEFPTLDITADYRLNDRMTLYFAGRNVENTAFTRWYFHEGQPLLYQAENFGTQYTIGVKGSF